MDITTLSLSGIFNLSNYLLANHEKIKDVNLGISKILNTELMLNNDAVKTEITVSGDGNTDEKKIHSLLEKLDLNIRKDSALNYGNVGLGTSNLMSMACEMLLNQDNNECSTFMLIEEPEAHIHAQRQLKLIQSMQSKGKNQQIIVTTHSPLLASVVELNNLIMIQNRKAFSMKVGETLLDASDYKYLERYLDATKSNLFFARGVIIVEGPGEALLLPSIANILGRNLTDYGVSIVDVKSTGLRRYAKIFQRQREDEKINIPVACITDRDEELEKYKKYGCHVIGMVHQVGKEVGVANYFADYNSEVKRQIPKNLIDYFWNAEEQMQKRGEFSIKVEYISKGIYKLLKKYSTKAVERSSSAFNSIIKTVPQDNREIIRAGLLEIMEMNWKKQDEWEEVISRILQLLSGIIRSAEARKDEFLQWKGVKKEENTNDVVNAKEYENNCGDKIRLNFGSIHSSKGRTHLATLVVETKYYEDNLTSILPWLSGKSKSLGVRNTKRLKCHYVAMTRAKGLLCLAIPSKNVSDKVRKELEEFGWNLEVIN